MKNDPLFQPLRLGPLPLPNRLVMTTVKLGYATDTGEVTDRHIAFYVRRAEGGAGLLTTEPMYIQRNGRELPTQLGIHTDAVGRGLVRMVSAVHGADGRLMAHINENYRKLQAGYLFPEIARRVREFGAAPKDPLVRS